MFRQTARLYDLVYEAQGKDYAAESAVVDALVQERRPGARTLLDVACGTGGHLRHLRHRYEVTGVDLDPGMLDEARTHLPDVRLVEGDMRTLRLEKRFDAVVCLFSSVGYLRDTEELGAALGAMAAHLTGGGVLVVDGWVRPDAWRGDVSTHVVTASDEETTVARVGRAVRQGRTTHLEMHHLVATPDGVEHLVDHHDLTLFSPADYETAFEEAGLVTEVVDSPMDGRDRYVGIRRS